MKEKIENLFPSDTNVINTLRRNRNGVAIL